MKTIITNCGEFKELIYDEYITCDDVQVSVDTLKKLIISKKYHGVHDRILMQMINNQYPIEIMEGVVVKKRIHTIESKSKINVTKGMISSQETTGGITMNFF